VERILRVSACTGNELFPPMSVPCTLAGSTKRVKDAARQTNPCKVFRTEALLRERLVRACRYSCAHAELATKLVDPVYKLVFSTHLENHGPRIHLEALLYSSHYSIPIPPFCCRLTTFSNGLPAQPPLTPYGWHSEEETRDMGQSTTAV
jgi:hypothetical protein